MHGFTTCTLAVPIACEQTVPFAGCGDYMAQAHYGGPKHAWAVTVVVHNMGSGRHEWRNWDQLSCGRSIGVQGEMPPSLVPMANQAVGNALKGMGGGIY